MPAAVTAAPAPMAERPWADRRRTLAYARTEARFYEEFAADAALAPQLARMGVRLPKLALSDNRMDVLLGDAAVHEAAGEEPSAEAQAAAGALLVLECGEGLCQASPVSEAQARQALRAVDQLRDSLAESSAGMAAARAEVERLTSERHTTLTEHGELLEQAQGMAEELEKLRASHKQLQEQS